MDAQPSNFVPKSAQTAGSTVAKDTVPPSPAAITAMEAIDEFASYDDVHGAVDYLVHLPDWELRSFFYHWRNTWGLSKR